MAVRKYLPKFMLLIIIFTHYASIQASKLNVPRVLLPIFNDFPTKFVLEATEGGCYKWSTTRNDIVQITLLDEDKELECATKAAVITVTKEAARNIAVVLAEDVHTKQMLRCDIIVDVIQELQISTTTRELFMEEAPEVFEVKAFDDQGNEFSTLEEIEFEWLIVSLGPNKDAVLRYITFRDSPYESPEAIEALENENKKGYAILLEGIKSGSAKVSVRLPYSEYKHVSANEVQLMVVANLLITPPDVYTMPGDVVSFKIFYLNNGRMEEVTLPDAQYYLEAEDMAIASSTKQSGNVTALAEGDTRIVLRDRNVGKDDPVLKLPAVNLHVVQPNYLVLNVLPHKNWAIQVGDYHDISVEVYSKKDHKLHIGPSVGIFLDVSPEFKIISRSNNGSWLTGYGIKPSVATVQASLDSVYSDKTGKIKIDPPITVTGDLMIYQRVTVTPSDIFLPWDPLTRPKYDIDLVAKGGDGRFLWTSSDHSIGIVSQTGRVHTLSDGFFEVSAVMQRNHYNRASAKIVILPPTRLEIVEFVMETEVGSPVHLHVALYADDVPFTQCQSLPFHIKQSDNKFKYNKTGTVRPIGISCGNIAMTALEVGTSKVTVTYFHDGKALEDSATISSYKPLALLQPKREIVLAVGSSVNLVYVGGPRPILGRSADHNRVIVSEDESLVQATDVTQFHTLPGEDYTVVNVLCRKLGETDIKLMISNSPSSSNCKAKSSSVITRVICGKPRKVVLYPELPITDAKACPMDLSTGNVVVHSTGNIDIDVDVYDDVGNKMLNISSLLLDWSVTPVTEARVEVKDGALPKNISVGTVPIVHKTFQRVIPTIQKTTKKDSKIHSECLLNVTVRNYKNDILRRNGIVPESPPFHGIEDANTELAPIMTSLRLYMVDDVVLSENSITVFNHPGNTRVVNLQQGSGYFELAIDREDIARVTYSESNKQIEVSPLKSGELMVQVLDLCLIARPATLFITVVSVAIIRVDMADKVEVGKCLSVIVRLYDDNDNLLEIPEDIGYVDVIVNLEEPIANVHRDERPQAGDKNQWGMGEIHFTLTGITVGNTKLVFTVSGTRDDVDSAPINLQVFHPLKISPRNTSILIGSEFEMMVSGGPTTDANIVFSTLSPTVAEISEKGILKGKSIGTAKITAQAIGIHPTTGNSLLYSQDSVEIEVVRLQNIKILTPLSRFRVGASVPFWVVGVPNISPLILGSVENPAIQFRWSAEDKLLVDLYGAFQPVGVINKRVDRVVAKIFALAPGQTRVFVNATIPGHTLNIFNIETMVLSATHDIEIIQEFALINPPLPGKSLLMAPYAEIQLITNLDSTEEKILYQLLDNKMQTTELMADKSDVSDSLVSVSSTGVIKSKGAIGHVLLLVTAVDKLGLRKTLSIVVQVKPIHFMNINIVAGWRAHSDDRVRIVPLGTEFQLKATFHDDIGENFHAGAKELKIRLNRCDLLEIRPSEEPASVWIYTKKAGVTVIKVWAEGILNTADYIKIRVDQSVQPHVDHLTAGDVICLRAPVVDQFNSPGHWRSSDPSLIKVNPALDIAFVLNKEGVVYLTHNLLASAPISIKIYPTSEIEFLQDPTVVLTNSVAETVTRFVLVLQSEQTVGKKTNNLIQGWRCRTDVRKLMRPTIFKCFAEFTNTSLPIKVNDIFNVSNSWVPETGQYACKLINLNATGKDVATIRTNVTIWAVSYDGEIESKRINVPFLPGVYVDNVLEITATELIAELKVIGLHEVLEQITVIPADSSILYVDDGKFVNDMEKVYQVQLIDYHWRLASLEQAMGVMISSLLTRQKLRVIVKVTGDLSKNICNAGRSPIMVFLLTYKYALAMGAAMMIIFLMTFYFYSNYMQPVVNVNVNPARSMLGGPGTGANRIQSPSQSPISPENTNTTFRCAANYAAAMNRMSPNLSQSPQQCRLNCTCALHARDPIYGDASTYFRASPEIRHNRRPL